MGQCYVCGAEINQVNRSEEHIILNSLGGWLSSTDILCNAHNCKLNHDVDSHFGKIFGPVAKRLAFREDRPINRRLRGTHVETQLKIVYESGAASPASPRYDEDANILYANDAKQARQYFQSPQLQGVEHDKIEIVTQLKGDFEFEFNLNSRGYRRGMAKIAAGFAAYNGIGYGDTPTAVDYKFQTILETPLVVPAIPNYLGLSRRYSGDHYYPVHWLALHGDASRNLLYCYVELFSVFQVFVILSETYNGPDIQKDYIYSLSDSKEIPTEEYLAQFSNDLMPLDGPHSFDLTEIKDTVESHGETLRMYHHEMFHRLELWMSIQASEPPSPSA